MATDVAGEQVARRAGDRAEAAERDAGEEVRCCVDYLIDVISGQGAEIQVNALQRDLMAEAVARETDVANALDLAGDAVKDVHEKVEEMDNKMAALEGRIATQIGEEKSDRIKHEHAAEEAAALVEKEHDTAHAVLEGHIDEQVANWTVGRWRLRRFRSENCNVSKTPAFGEKTCPSLRSPTGERRRKRRSLLPTPCERSAEVLLRV